MNAIQLVVRRGALWSVAMMTACLLVGTTAEAQVCGDNLAEAPELCDGTDDAFCPGLCLPPGDPNECRCATCGDGDANQVGEDCDGGDDAACPGLCWPAGSVNECRCPFCGDGATNLPGEQCDGYDDFDCAGRCTATCTCAVCGDNVAEGPPETCDGTDDAACPGACPAPGDPYECRCPVCNDGVINQVTEVCDRHDDAACPGHCTYSCTCAVCGDNVAESPVERCDGTADTVCPGLCFPPGDPHECVCPITLNKCAAKKEKCVNNRVSYLLKCHVSAELKALGPPDAYCVDKADYKWDGGITPTRGCFERLELPGHCFTEDDTGSIGTKVDAFVNDVVLQLDPSYPGPVFDRCSAAKKKCVMKFATNLLKCRAKYEAKNVPIDPVCVQKATDKFDGGFDPSRGCFERLELKFAPTVPCTTTDDTSALATTVNDFVQDVACDLDPYRPECSTCGNGIAESPPEDCDGGDDAACPGACTIACECP